jgi:hypothetical protein
MPHTDDLIEALATLRADHDKLLRRVEAVEGRLDEISPTKPEKATPAKAAAR